MHRIDGAGHSNNTFIEGDPQVPTPATTVTDDWLNAVQDEIVNVIEQSGDTLDKADNSQLYQALQVLGLQDATETQKGKIELATAAEAQGLSDLLKALTPGTLDAAFKGGNQSLVSNGYQKLPGGLILEWGNYTTAAVAGDPVVVTLPLTVPTGLLYVNGIVFYAGVSSRNIWAADTTTSSITLRSNAVSTGCLWLVIGR